MGGIVSEDTIAVQLQEILEEQLAPVVVCGRLGWRASCVRCQA